MTMFQHFKTCYYYNTLNNGSSCPFLCPSIHRKLLTKNVTAAAHKQQKEQLLQQRQHNNQADISVILCTTQHNIPKYRLLQLGQGTTKKQALSCYFFLMTCNIVFEQKNKTSKRTSKVKNKIMRASANRYKILLKKIILRIHSLYFPGIKVIEEFLLYKREGQRET